MKMRRSYVATISFTALLAVALANPAPAAAHCDSLDGPVVNAARAALSAGDVTPVLPWVLADDEPVIRAAFERTLRVRAAAPEARELADLWFFETLVRVHRAGEGAPYTGLKPVGWQAPALITAADRALDDGQIDELATRVAEHVAREIRQLHAHASALKDFAPADIETGRRYVEAYVAYTHFLEALHHQLHGGGGHAAAHSLAPGHGSNH
jgi:hypothetical protein